MVFAFEERLMKDIEQSIKSILNEVGFVIARPLGYEIALWKNCKALILAL